MDNLKLMTDLYEVLSKVREEKKFIAGLPLAWRKPYLVLLKTCPDPKQAREALFYLMEVEVQFEVA